MNNPDHTDLEQRLRQARITTFDAGFADRVVQRMRLPRVLPLGARLQRPFLLLLPAAIAAILVLGFINVRAQHGRDPLSAALGLPTVTLDAAYSLSVSPEP